MPLISAREHIERASAEMLYALSDINFMQESVECDQARREWENSRVKLVVAMKELACVVRALSNAHQLAALRFEAAELNSLKKSA